MQERENYKIEFLALRSSYHGRFSLEILVFDANLIAIYSKAKWLCDRFCPLLEQYALTDWIREGYF